MSIMSVIIIKENKRKYKRKKRKKKVDTICNVTTISKHPKSPCIAFKNRRYYQLIGISLLHDDLRQS